MEAVNRFEKLLSENVLRLLKYTNEQASCKLVPEKWSKKEILGHLTDSAFNNHQRFVRMQIENNLDLLQYRQNEWVAVQKYQELEWAAIVELWLTVNKHILHVIKHMNGTKLTNTARFPDYGVLSLQFLVDDYIDHMLHHFKAIFHD